MDNELTYLILASGQAVKGYLNRKDLHLKHDYSFVHTGAEGNIQSRKILNRPGKAGLYNLFSTNERIKFPSLAKDEIYVHLYLSERQYQDSNLLKDIRFIEDKEDKDKVFIHARTLNASLVGVRLNPIDTRIFHATKSSGNNEWMDILRHGLASVYYKDAIEVEQKRIEATTLSLSERAKEQYSNGMKSMR